MSDFLIYTDGACSGNPGPGGWAFITIKSSDTSIKIESSGSELNTTNNRMELTAVINGLYRQLHIVLCLLLLIANTL